MMKRVLLFSLVLGTTSWGCSGSDDEDGQEMSPEGDGDHDHRDGDHDHGDGDHSDDDEGLALCCEMSAVCHVTGGTTDTEVEECHNIGHTNDPEACRADYDRCMDACVGANDDPMEHGCE